MPFVNGRVADLSKGDAAGQQKTHPFQNPEAEEEACTMAPFSLSPTYFRICTLQYLMFSFTFTSLFNHFAKIALRTLEHKMM